MITIGQVVFNKKNQKGTITKIITKSTGYVEMTLENGTIKKEMAFNLKDENGNALKKAPVRKVDNTPVSPLDSAISRMKWINACTFGDRCSLSYEISETVIVKVEMAAKELGNTFICDVCHSVIKFMKCSDKQAYVLAKFALENNVDINN